MPAAEAGHRPIPLSASQENIYRLESAYPGFPINNICCSVEVSGWLDLTLLRSSLIELLRGFPQLMTQITLVGGVPHQRIAGQPPSEFPYYDFSLSGGEGADRWIESAARERFKLIDSPLYSFAIYKAGEDRGGVLLKVHHILSDAWTQAMLGGAFAEAYGRLLTGRGAPAKAERPAYSAHVEEERAYLSSPDRERDEAYWRERMESHPLPEERGVGMLSPTGRRASYKLSERLCSLIRRYCEDQRLSPFAPIHMALTIYMKRVRRRGQTCVGVPIHNRRTVRDKRTAGMFVNTLPFIAEIDDDLSLNEIKDAWLDGWYSLIRHQRLPFSIIRELSGGTGALFDVVLSYQNAAMAAPECESASFEGRWHYAGCQAEPLILHLSEGEGGFRLDYDYLIQLYKESEIEGLHRQIEGILSGALSEPDRPVRELRPLAEPEADRVIYDFNRSRRDFPFRENLAEELIGAEERYSGRVAVISRGRRLRYGELIRSGRALAARIAGVSAEGGGIVVVALPRDEELFVAIAGVLLSGNAYLLIDPDQPDIRLRELIEACGPILVLADGDRLRALEGIEAPAMTVAALRALPPAEGGARRAAGTDPAYYVYTSGSSGAPKAVKVLHRGVQNFAYAMRPLYGRGAVLSLCSASFDAFVIESIAALVNAKTVVIADERARNDPAALTDLIRAYDVSFMAMTPSRLSAYLGNAAFAKSLGRMECILTGGERFPSELFQTLKTLTNARIVNQYGPSEATVGVSFCDIRAEGSITLGKPMANCVLYVLNERMQPQPVGAPGEIYVGGICLAGGYLNAPELTGEKFLPDPFRPGERVYKTGDLGSWTEGGELVFLGRIDMQLKLNGHRIEPTEIEARLRAHPAVEGVAVKLFGEKFLAAYYTSKARLEPEDFQRFAALCLPRYMLPRTAQRIDDMPMTINGKIDYRRLPEPDAREDRSEPESERERGVLEIWRRVLRNPAIGMTTDYFAAGGDSLNAVVVFMEVEARFGRSVEIAELYANNTPRAFAALLGDAAPPEEERPVVGRAPELPEYPLSPAQRSFYVLSQLDPESLSYNMPGAFSPDRPIDPGRLEEAIREYIRGDALFRTRFEIRGGGAAQILQEDAPFELSRIRAADWREAFRGFVRPFDLERPPLLRAALCEDGEGGQTLFLDMHHIVSDGISSELMMRRLSALYAGDEVDFPYLRYVDYAHWRASMGEGELELQRNYWRERVEGMPEPLELPSDRPRALAQGGKSAKVEIGLTRAESDAMEERLRGLQATPYMFALAIFARLLSEFGGQREFFVGTPVSGRNQRELRDLTGAFVRSMPIRMRPDGDKPLSSYLSEVKESVLSMIDNQDLPFEEIVAMTGRPRELGRNTIYRIMFSLRPIDAMGFALGDARLTPLDTDSGDAKLELSLEAVRGEDGYRFYFEYMTSLFSKETIELYARGFRAALLYALGHEDALVRDLPSIAEADRHALIEDLNGVRVPYDASPVDRVIDRIAEESPKATAIEWGNGYHYSFGDVSHYSDRLAARLIGAGVGVGDRVALIARRDGNLLPAMLAILKAGAAYVPIDPAYPADRIRYMIGDTGAKLLLLSPGEPVPEGADCPAMPISFESAGEYAPPEGRGPEDAMYVLYTSGSTGQPKGVPVPHRAIANLIHDGRRLYNYAGAKAICSAHAIFDIFATETWMPLCMGRPVVMADEEEMLLPWKLAKRMAESRANALQLTPSRMQMCLSDPDFERALGSMSLVMLIGEPWGAQMLNSIRAAGAKRIVNLYGPTEATVHAGWADLTGEDEVHFGRPIENCRFYAMDEAGRCVPPTAVGELYIAGDCIAHGYLNKPELAAEAFLPDPFYPGERMYRTGDIVRLRADGNWVFMGRRDKQIKLSGHRVELDEIADAILKTGMAREVAILPEKHHGAYTAIRAFIVPSPELEPAELKRRLFAALPDYMVPATVTALSQLPRTPSGKTDLKALEKLDPADVSEAPAAQKAPEPRGDALPPLQKLLSEIWAEALDRSEVSETRSFFEQGGSSLGALAALSRYYRHGLKLTLDEFYRYPTIQRQAALLGETDAPKPAGEAARLPARIPEGGEIGVREGDVLVTGATGFLGAHLLRELAALPGGRLICAVRGGEGALRAALTGYFGASGAEAIRIRCEAVRADLTKERLGLSEADYGALAGRVSEIFHMAADVRHYAADESIDEVNAGGTARIVELAKAAGAALYHASTASVSGERLTANPDATVLFRETDLDIGQNLSDNAYILSKARAEATVALAMAEGLPAQILRIGRLVGRASDGAFQRNPETNALYRLVSGLSELGAIPESIKDAPLEYAAVDWCAGAIAALRGKRAAAYHLCGSGEATLSEVLPLTVVSDERFRSLLESAIEAGGSDYLNAVAERILPGAAPAMIRVDRQATRRALRAAGCDARPDPEGDIRRLLGIDTA